MEMTLNQAAKECNRAKSTISKAIKSGKLTAVKQQNGSYLIEVSELFRVFPKKNTDDGIVPLGNTLENADNLIKIKALEAEAQFAEKMEAELRTQIEELRVEKAKWQEQAAAQTRLLESSKPTKRWRLFGR